MATEATAPLATVTSVIRDDAAHVVRDLAPELDALAGTTLVLTGAGGFLGATFLDVLAAFNAAQPRRPCRVLALDNFQTGLPDRVRHLDADPHVTFVTHDVTRPWTPPGGVDWILHAASIASPSVYRRFPLETIDVNVNGTWRCLELARSAGARGMLYLSSSEIYGDPAPEAIPTGEEYRGSVSCTGPRACYDESKRLGETLCTTYARLHGTPVGIVRPFNVYGPGQRLDDQRILPDLLSAALAGRPAVLHSDGRATRSFCYVRDFVRGALLVLLAGGAGEAFNVGDDREISIATLAELVADAAAPPRRAVEYRASADADYLADNPQRRCPDLTKLRTRTRWRPEVPLEEGLRRTLASYREAAGRA
jgi:dTDP-glucose 4,6-dehydratase/UDP-glucuronate decarboxylase